MSFHSKGRIAPRFFAANFFKKIFGRYQKATVREKSDVLAGINTVLRTDNLERGGCHADVQYNRAKNSGSRGAGMPSQKPSPLHYP
jgi:hypothetical protein